MENKKITYDQAAKVMLTPDEYTAWHDHTVRHGGKDHLNDIIHDTRMPISSAFSWFDAERSGCIINWGKVCDRCESIGMKKLRQMIDLQQPYLSELFPIY